MDREQLRADLRQSVKELCGRFPESYWQRLDAEREYPEAFVAELTRAGWLSALIPEDYGGAGLGMAEAAIVLEEVNRSGGNAGACHAQMYTMGALLRHGTPAQKQRYLPGIASGELRLQAFAVTEPDAGSDTTAIATFAERRGDRYVVHGRKIFTSRLQHSDLMLLLARTARREQVARKTDGLSLFIVDLRTAGDALRIRPLRMMINHETNELALDGLDVPAENLVGEEGRGFSHVLSGMNAERILLASESVGDGLYFVDRASSYARERVVFGHPIGRNQGVQFPIAQAYVEVRAAALMRDRAADLFDGERPCGAEANMAKFLASEAAKRAADAAMATFGGYGLTAAYGVERKFREARLNLVAPVANNLVLSFVGEHVLGMPRSY